MANIEVALDHRAELNLAHAEYVASTKAIETIVEGPPVFSGMVATAHTYIVSQGFEDFLTARHFPFKAR